MFLKNIFIASILQFKYKYGGCSLVAEHGPVESFPRKNWKELLQNAQDEGSIPSYRF